MIIAHFVNSEWYFVPILNGFPKSKIVVSRLFYNADFKNSKVQKSICNASRDLAGISVKGMVLIPVSCSVFL